MPVCEVCGTFSSLDRSDPQSRDLVCRNCGQRLLKKGTTVRPSKKAVAQYAKTQGLPVEKDARPLPVPVKPIPQDPPPAQEKDRSPTLMLGLILAFVTGGLVVGLTTNYYVSQRVEGKIDSFLANYQEGQGASSPEDALVEEGHIPLLSQQVSSLDLLLGEGVRFSASSQELRDKNPDLHPLSQEENHFAIFALGLEVPLDPPIPLQNIFYFFDEGFLLESIQYDITPQENQEETQAKEIQDRLSQLYPLVQETSDYALWEAEDGWIGLHKGLLFLHLSPEEAILRSIFK